MSVQDIFVEPIKTALEGWRYYDVHTGREYSLHRPKALGVGPRSGVYLAERHWHGDSAITQAPMFDYVVIKTRWPEFSNGKVYAHRHDPIDHEAARRNQLGRLPFMGNLPHRADLPMERFRCDFFEVVSSATLPLLITPLRRESFGGTAPITLAASLPRYGCYTQREMVNWFELADGLARALWSIHAQGRAHCDIKPENIVLRTDHGYWRDINLIDFEHVTDNEIARMIGYPGTWLYFRPERISDNEYVSSPAREDIYALGVTLLDVLRGKEWRDSVLVDTTSGAKGAGQYPEEIRRWAADFDHDEPHIRNRAKQLCHRYLLCDHFDTPVARVAVERSAERDSARAEPVEVTLSVLDEFLDALHKLRIRQHRCQLHTIGTGNTREPAPVSKGYVMLLEMTSMSRLVGRTELMDWCQRYIAEMADAATAFAEESGHFRPLPAREPVETVRYGVELLRAGYGHAAQDWFAMLLSDHSAQLDSEETVRVLRLLTGVLMPRTRKYQAACQILAPYEHADDPSVRWWARMLRQKLAHHGRERFPYGPHQLGNPPSRRGTLWLRVTEILSALRRGEVVTDVAPRLRGAMSAAQSAYETSVVALCIARVYGSSRELYVWRRAVPTILMAANHAVTGKLPYEYAASLSWAAKLVCNAFDDDALGRALHEQGLDTEEALVIAGRCASLAAEIYQMLGASHLNVVALEQAADAYLRCPSPERRTEGIRYMSLAQSNGALWSDSTEYERHQERMTEAVARWRQAAVEGDRAEVASDPGAVLAHHYYGRNSNLLLHLWDEPIGLAVERFDSTTYHMDEPNGGDDHG